MPTFDERAGRRLQSEHNIWVATVRPDGRPHLTPTWFAWQAGKIYLCIDPDSVKARNLAHNDRVTLALENGTAALILEGTARPVEPADGPPEVLAEFKRKYAWDVTADGQYSLLVEITLKKVLHWGEGE